MVRNLIATLPLLASVPALAADVKADAKADPKAADKAAKAEKPVSFHKDVWPILQRQCQGCHQPAKKGGGLAVTSCALLTKGGKAGAGIVVGKPDESPLIHSLVGEGIAVMPKGGEPLPKEKIDLVRRWIAEGAKDDTPAAERDEISADKPPVYEGRPLITALAFSPDGQTLAVGGYREILLHAADGSQLKARLVGLSQRIQSLAYSPDGSLLAGVGGSPGRFGEVQFWDTKSGALKSSASFTNDTLFGASWSPDGSKLAFGCADNSCRVIDVKTGKQILKFDHHTDFVLGTAFSVDGKNMVTVSRDRAVKLSYADSGAFIDNITSITPGALTGGLEALERRPGKNEVAVGGIDGVPKLYRMFRERARAIGDDFNLIRAFEKLPGKVSALQFNKDGSLLAAAGTGEARVYRVDDGARLAVVKFDGGLYAVAFHPSNGTFAAGGYDGLVKIAKADNGQVLREFIPVPFTPSVAKK